jgi:type II secretory pathway pseudopilin PulG
MSMRRAGRCTARGRRASQAGVTMIELIVSMGVISLVFVGLGEIFYQAVSATNIGNAQGEVHQQARTVFDHLGQDLRGVPRGSRLIVRSPVRVLATWGVTVHGDVLAFVTATPRPVRKSTTALDPLVRQNFAGVCYYRWHRHDIPINAVKAADARLFRVLDRLDTGGALADLNVGPLDPPPTEDEIALRLVTPRKGSILPYGAFEIEVYSPLTGTFIPIADGISPDNPAGGVQEWDSARDGMPRAIRVRLRLVDQSADRGEPHLRDDVRGERGVEFVETFWLAAGE